MGKKDYTKYSEQSENNMIIDEIIDTVVDEVVDTVVDEVVDAVVDNVVVEPEVETTVEDIKNAIVVGCVKLNVRKEPNKDSEVVCVIEEFHELTIDTVQSTNDFYKIYTSVNDVLVEGYCMKKFINIK